MSTTQLCFGPYNDPVAPSGNKYCSLPHDSCCRNPAFVIRREGDGTYIANVAVRNVSGEMSPNDITVSFYGCGIPPLLTPDRVDLIVRRLLKGFQTNLITGQTTFSINPNTIAPFSPASDAPWTAGPVYIDSPTARGVLLVATLACPTWSLYPLPDLSPSQDPCVAVWVGP